MTAEPAHAPLAPSSAEMWGPGGCPASVAMQSRQPPQEETEENREGTAAHWLLEQVLLKLTVPADAIAPNGVPINDEMREAIQELVTDVNDTLKSCQSGDYFQVEQRVGAAQMIHPDNWGTPDVFFVQHSRKTLHIWDFKYGHRFVDVMDNWQLIDYAACIIETESITDWRDWTFTFTIAQPRCYVRDELGATLREWFTDGTRLALMFDQLRAAAFDAMAPDAMCKVGSYCLDCLAAWDCEALQRTGGNVLALTGRQTSLGMEPTQIGLELAMRQDGLKLLEAQIKALETRAQSLINDGQNVPRFNVKYGDTRTVWQKDKQAEAAQLVQMFGIDVQLGVAIPTPAQCIKQGVDAAVITPYTTKNPAAHKLVRVSDKTALKVFGRRD